MDHLSRFDPLFINCFEGISHINILMGSRWLCLIREGHLCVYLILIFESFRYQEKSATKGIGFSRVQRVSLLICRCMVDWWFRSFSFISILIQKISLQISLVILSMTFIWHPDDKSNVYMVVLVDLF